MRGIHDAAVESSLQLKLESKGRRAARTGQASTLRRRGVSAPRPTRRAWTVERLEERRVMAGEIAADFSSGLPTFGSVDELKSYVRTRADELYANHFGESPDAVVYPLSGDQFFTTGQFFRADGSTGVLGDDASDHSTTNVQVAGVDEADFVETDGNYAYLARHGELTIVSLHPATSMAVVGKATLTGMARGMFLRGERLTVITSTSHPWPLDSLPDDGAIRAYDDLVYRSKMTTTVSIFDVSDPSSPRIVDRTEIDADFVDARAVADHVFVETSKFDGAPSPLRMHCVDGPPRPWLLTVDVNGNDAIPVDGSWIYETTCTYETREEYFSHLEAELDSLVDAMLPHFSTWIGGDTFVRGGALVDPADLVRPIAQNSYLVSTVTSFQVFDNQPGPVASVSMLGRPESARLGTADRLYWFENDWSADTVESITRIVSIEWNGLTGELRAEGHGEVLGHTLNSFSADQHGDQLRLVTTRPTRFDGEARLESESMVSVLELDGAQWNIIGQVAGLAPGEHVRATRFAGDTAYVVTFRQIDPLFVIDLSDPTAPSVQGELKIPGYSGHLQSLDATHVLGIGMTPTGPSGRWRVELSIFDVSDPTQPQRVGQYAFPDDIDATDAMYAPHALSYFPEWNLLGLPIHGRPSLTSELDWTAYFASDYQHLAFLKLDWSGNAAPSDVIKPVGRVGDLSNYVFGSFRAGGNVYVATDHELVAVVGANPSHELGRAQFTPFPEPWYSSEIYDATAFGFANFFDPTDPTVSGSPIESWTGEKVDAALDAGLRWATAQFDADASAVRLVSVESTEWDVGGETRRGYNLVLAFGDRQILARVDERLNVELVNDDFEFASDLLRGEWHNSDEPLDTDSDGSISPMDGLVLINELNRRGAVDLRRARPLRSVDAQTASGVLAEFAPQPFFDVNGDDYLSPIDALLVINWLNGPPAAEGESSVPSQAATRLMAVDSTRLAPMATATSHELETPIASELVGAGNDSGDAGVSAENETQVDASRKSGFTYAVVAVAGAASDIVSEGEDSPGESDETCAGGWDFAAAADALWSAT